MNISVSLHSGSTLQQRTATPPVSENKPANTDSALPVEHQNSMSSDKVDKIIQTAKQDSNKAPEQQTQQQESNQGKVHLKVNNPDYKIKMLIEQQVGTSTLQTELNFYHQPGTYDTSGINLDNNKGISRGHYPQVDVVV